MTALLTLLTSIYFPSIHQIKAQSWNVKKKKNLFSSDKYKIGCLKTLRTSAQMVFAFKQKRNIVVQEAEDWKAEFWVPVLSFPSISMYFIASI